MDEKMKLYSHLSLNKHGLLGESSCHRFLLSHRFTVAIDIIMSLLVAIYSHAIYVSPTDGFVHISVSLY